MTSSEQAKGSEGLNLLSLSENYICFRINDGEHHAREHILEWRSVNSKQICPQPGNCIDVIHGSENVHKSNENRSERENVPKHPGPQTIQNNIPYLLDPKQAEHPRHPFPHNILNPLLNLSLSLRRLPIPVDTHPRPHGLGIDRRACHHIDFHRVCPLTFVSADEENGRRKDRCVGVESAFGSRLCDA